MFNNTIISKKNLKELKLLLNRGLSIVDCAVSESARTAAQRHSETLT